MSLYQILAFTTHGKKYKKVIQKQYVFKISSQNIMWNENWNYLRD